MTCNLIRHSERRFCCAGCGRAFSSMVAFDGHRATDRSTGRRVCLNLHDACDKHGNRRFEARIIKGRVGEVPIWGTAGKVPNFWEDEA